MGFSIEKVPSLSYSPPAHTTTAYPTEDSSGGSISNSPQQKSSPSLSTQQRNADAPIHNKQQVYFSLQGRQSQIQNTVDVSPLNEMTGSNIDMHTQPQTSTTQYLL